MEDNNSTPRHDQDSISQTAENRVKQVFLGRISSQWKYVQQKWYEEITSKGRILQTHQTPQVWATNLCRRLMFFALHRWQIRSEVYHDRVSKYSYQRDRDALIKDVTTRYATPQPDHPAVNPLFSHSLEEFITSTNSSIQAWMFFYDLIRKFLRPRLIPSYLGT